MNSQTQSGFTLVELMVALVIGLLIVLGAGQLYLTGFQNFRQVEVLSNRQAVLMFAADTLIRDVRRGEVKESGEVLSIEVNESSGSCTYTYQLSEDYSLMLDNSCSGGGYRKLVPGFAKGGFCADEKSPGFYKITFRLRKSLDGDNLEEYEEVTFHAMNRTAAVNGPEGSEGSGKVPDPNNFGYYEDGSSMYEEDCYKAAVNLNLNGGVYKAV